MKKDYIVYLAALIDGEGSIQFKRERKSFCRIPAITIISTTPELVDWLPNTFGGSVFQEKLKDRDRAPIAYRYTVQRQSALDMFKELKKYMRSINKLARIQMLLSRWQVVNKNSPQDMKDKAATLELDFFREYGHKGKIIHLSDCVLEFLKSHPEMAITNYEVGKGPISTKI